MTTFKRSLQFFFLFFLPKIGQYLGASMLGSYTNYFRKVFWDSMDSRSVTKMKRGDLIDSLLQLKDEKPDNTNIREYLTRIDIFNISMRIILIIFSVKYSLNLRLKQNFTILI